MKNILKSPELEELKNYKKPDELKKNKNAPEFKRWKHFKRNGPYNSVRETLVRDQKGLCAYCEIDLHPESRSRTHDQSDSEAVRIGVWH